MEENGIGRPSTYAPTVSTILDREYVIKEGKYLRLTPSGRGGQRADGASASRDIVDVKFTAHMEQKLDDVEAGTGQLEGPAPAVLRAVSMRTWKRSEKDMEGVYLKVP